MTRRRIIIFGALALILTAGVTWLFLFNRFVLVPTSAMANTILPGESMLVDPFVGEIKRGDVIVFKYPLDPSTRYVKRVIGLPGETIEIRDTRVFINQKELGELRVSVEGDRGALAMRELSSEGEGSYHVFYYSDEHQTRTAINPLRGAPELLAVHKPFAVPDGTYFVMGDNRDNSQDSRYWGPVSRELITGRPYLIYWSVERGEGAGSERIRWDRIFSRLK